MSKVKLFQSKDGRQYQIRAAGVEDSQLLVDYMRVLTTDAPYILTSKEDFHFDVELERKWLEQQSSLENWLMLLAIHEEQVVGCLDIRPGTHNRAKHRAALGMGVIPGWRGQGVGRVMLNEALEFANASDGLKKVELGVICRNFSALNLYASVGFKEEGRSIKGFKSDGGDYHDEIHMGIWVA